MTDGAGREQVDRLVACPGGRMVPVEACAKCGYGRGQSFDEEYGREVLECDRDDGTELPISAAYDAKLKIVPVIAVASLDVIAVQEDTPIAALRSTMLEAA